MYEFFIVFSQVETIIYIFHVYLFLVLVWYYLCEPQFPSVARKAGALS